MKKALTKPSAQLEPTTLRRRFLTWLLSPKGSTLVIGLFFVVATLIAIYFVRGYTSDDIVWQNALLTWSPFNGHTYYTDAGVTYLAKLPLYWLLSLIFSPGRHVILVTSLILAVINFFLVYKSYLYFLKIAKIPATRVTLLPLLWLASFGFGLAQQFFSPNLHNVEIGFILIFLVGVSKLLRGDYAKLSSRGKVIGFIIAGFLTGLMIIDDRYTLYFGVLPGIIMAIVYLLKKATTRQRLISFAVVVVLAMVAYELIKIIAEHAGISFVTGSSVAGDAAPEIIGFNAFQNNLFSTFHNLLIIFGADFFGRKIVKPLTIITLLNFVLLCVSIAWSGKLALSLRNKVADKTRAIEIAVLGVTVFFAITIYTLSTLSGGDTSTYRYLMIIPYVACIVLAFGIYHASAIKKYIVIVLIGAILCNIGSSILGVKDLYLINEPYDPTYHRLDEQGFNFRLIDEIKALGLTKGYATYWNANLNTYLSKGSVQFLPVLCGPDNNTKKFVWLLDGDQFSKPASRTFYIDDPFYPLPPLCSTDSVLKQFGQPAETVPLEGRTIYVYDYDITSRLE